MGIGFVEFEIEGLESWLLAVQCAVVTARSGMASKMYVIVVRSNMGLERASWVDGMGALCVKGNKNEMMMEFLVMS